MTTYFDTSLLVKLYVPEIDSRIAVEWAERLPGGPMMSALSEVEFAAALRARSWRAQEPAGTGMSAIYYEQFLADVASGKFLVVPLDDDCFALARSLAEQYGGSLGVRALDVLHVAAAMRNGAEAFGTFDLRQGRLVEAVGLRLMA